MKTIIAKRSAAQGFPRSRFPTFTNEEKAMLKGTIDLIAVNSYTSFIVKANAHPNMTAYDWDFDAEVDAYQLDSWESTGIATMRVRI